MVFVKLKPINQQILVITGASSGIGLATARMAAGSGARLVLAGRSENALQRLVEEIRNRGGQAVCAVADVGKRHEVHAIAETALQHFGGFDTWVNNAGVSIFGRLEEVSEEDSRRLFETNFWGVVYGSLEAIAHLKHRGGALINMGSAASDRSLPLQGMYSATKHAVKAFTDALRIECEQAKYPVSVTLIKPTSINTPLPQHAKNYMPSEPAMLRPIYAPEVVASNILHAATHPTRDLVIGGAGRVISALGSSKVGDKYLGMSGLGQQQAGTPPAPQGHPQAHEILDQPAEDLRVHGDYTGHVMKSSAYTAVARRPVLTSLLALAAGMGVAALLTSLARGGSRESA